MMFTMSTVRKIHVIYKFITMRQMNTWQTIQFKRELRKPLSDYRTNQLIHIARYYEQLTYCRIDHSILTVRYEKLVYIYWINHPIPTVSYYEQHSDWRIDHSYHTVSYEKHTCYRQTSQLVSVSCDKPLFG